MRIALVLAATALLASADDRWIFVRSGPFEVWTDGPDKQAKLRLLEAEQFRHAFGYLLGKPDLKTTFPVRIYLIKDKKAPRVVNQLRPVRDLLVSNIYGEDSLNADWRRAMARQFLEANAKRFTPEIEEGLIEVLAPLEVNGTRLTLEATEPGKRSAGWARLHLLTTDPRFAGKLRVFLSNLENGVDVNAAAKNAFEITGAEIDRLAAEHAKKSAFEAASLPGRPLSWERDFPVRNPSPEAMKIARADAGLGRYEDATGPEALESQGKFAEAVAAGSKSAMAWYQLGLTEKDALQASVAFKKAAELNPAWPEPHVEMAKREAAVPARALTAWKAAAALAPRNIAIWKQYALTAIATNQYADAAKAWAGAERAAATDAERAGVRQARLEVEEKRAEFTENERQRAREEREREMQRLKNETLSAIREAEAKANSRLGQGPAPENVEKWWDDGLGPKQRIEGMLERVDCSARGAARVAVRENGKLSLIPVKEPRKIAIVGAKEATLPCGVQRPARKVLVEHTAANGLILIEFKQQ